MSSSSADWVGAAEGPPSLKALMSQEMTSLGWSDSPAAIVCVRRYWEFTQPGLGVTCLLLVLDQLLAVFEERCHLSRSARNVSQDVDQPRNREEDPQVLHRSAYSCHGWILAGPLKAAKVSSESDLAHQIVGEPGGPVGDVDALATVGCNLVEEQADYPLHVLVIFRDFCTNP